MERNIQFTAGATFKNRNGSTYQVLHSTTNDETTVMSLTKMPWVCVAHNICKLDDGTYEWSHSDQVGFLEFIQQYVERWCKKHHKEIVGGLEHFIVPWWDECDDDVQGVVDFVDADDHKFSTDGDRVYVWEG